MNGPQITQMDADEEKISENQRNQRTIKGEQ